MQDGAAACEQRCAAAESRTDALADRLGESERRLEAAVGEPRRQATGSSCPRPLLLLLVVVLLAAGLLGGLAVPGLLTGQTVEELAALKSEHARLLRRVGEHRARIDSHEKRSGVLAAGQDGQARDLRALREDHSSTAQELRAARDELDRVLMLLAGVQRAWWPAPQCGQASCKNRLRAGTPETPEAGGYEASINLTKSGTEADSSPTSRPRVL